MHKHANVVRFRVKPGYQDQFEKSFADRPVFEGMTSSYLVRTGEQSYCSVGIWESEDKMVAARPQMIAFLDSFRANLEELSPELGVTDPVSGVVITE